MSKPKTAEAIAQHFIDSFGRDEFVKAEDGKYWYTSSDNVNGIDLKYYFTLLIDYIQEDYSLSQQTKPISDKEIEKEFPSVHEKGYNFQDLNSRDNYYKIIGAKWMRDKLLPSQEAKQGYSEEDMRKAFSEGLAIGQDEEPIKKHECYLSGYAKEYDNDFSRVIQSLPSQEAKPISDSLNQEVTALKNIVELKLNYSRKRLEHFREIGNKLAISDYENSCVLLQDILDDFDNSLPQSNECCKNYHTSQLEADPFLAEKDKEIERLKAELKTAKEYITFKENNS